MHVNPCGRAVDWIQFPFEVDARLHDSADAPLVRLRWVYTDQPFFPPDFQNKITNRIWNADQHSEEIPGMLPVGENNYRQDARWILFPFAFSGHMCNPDWMVTGEPWPVPPSLPPTVYLAGWVPECCIMACDATECRREPVNDEPASQVTQFAIPAVEATDTTPALRQFVTDAHSTAGGNWPAAGQEWFPEGTAGPIAYSVVNLAQPDGTPFSRVEQMQFDSGNVFSHTITDLVETWGATVGGVTGALTMQPLGTQMQLGGSNLVVAPSILPAGIEYRRTMGVIAAGTTQGTAAPTQSTGTEAVALSTAAGIRMHISGAAPLDVSSEANGIYTVVHVSSSPVASLQLYPAVGDAWPGLGLNNPMTLARDTGVILIQNAGRQGSWAVIPFPGTGGSVTSVNITPPAAGITAAGGPIVSAGSITLALADDLAALEALAGTNTIYYRSAVNTWTAVSIGPYLSFAGGTLDALPPTATNTEAAGGAFSITGATGVYQATGLTVSVAGAGTYLITAKVRAQLQPGAAGTHLVKVKLRNNTDAADVANSETLVALCAQNGVLVSQTAGFSALVTVAGAKTFELYAARNGTTWTASDIVNDANGRTVIDVVKLA